MPLSAREKAWSARTAAIASCSAAGSTALRMGALVVRLDDEAGAERGDTAALLWLIGEQRRHDERDAGG